jgi:hypothetical protein
MYITSPQARFASRTPAHNSNGLLQSGVDRALIPLWLRHESIETTQIYLHANLAIKREMLAKATPINARSGLYRPDDDLLAFLKSTLTPSRLCRIDLMVLAGHLRAKYEAFMCDRNSLALGIAAEVMERQHVDLSFRGVLPNSTKQSTGRHSSAMPASGCCGYAPPFP